MSFPAWPGPQSTAVWGARAGAAPEPATPSYDEFVGELSVSIGDHALRRLDSRDGQLVHAVLSAATVSCHWLLSEDLLTEIDTVEGRGLGRHFRARYRAGEPPDRMVIQSLIAVSGALLTIFYVEPTERSRTLRLLTDALSIGADLEKDGSTLLHEAGASEIAFRSAAALRLANLAAELIARYTAPGDGSAPVLSPFKLLVMIDSFDDFFAGLRGHE
jgi:hypothetical protein